MIVAKAPGKLFIAGEYAVVTPGYSAVLVTVDRFINVTLKQTSLHGSIYSQQYNQLPLKWNRVNNQLTVDKKEHPLAYLLEAIAVTEEYALLNNKKLELYDLKDDSELISKDGIKYGLGSSAAITIATIRALLRFYEIDANDDLVFKLACLAHLNLGSNGSFGDLAAATYTGWICYTSFDRQAVLTYYQQHGLQAVLSLEWPLLKIERLQPLIGLDLMIGWTKSPQSTPTMVSKISKSPTDPIYAQFLESSKAVVNQIVQGFKENDIEAVLDGIARNRVLLKTLNDDIETPELSKLIAIANQFGVAKTSGAGGGDCGIVLLDKTQFGQQLIEQWQKADITCLPLNIYEKEFHDET